MKVLIADDHQLIIDDLIDEVAGIAPDAFCIGTSNSTEVMDLFRQHGFDVIIMDIDMPEINGIELAKQILAIEPRTNIIYITGHSSFALDSYQTYASAFLLKPISTEKLRDAFEHLRHPISNITDEMIAAEYSGNSAIGKRIAKAREQRGMTREALANEMQVTVTTISRWESGKRVPDIVTFLKLSQVLSVDPGQLMQGGE